MSSISRPSTCIRGGVRSGERRGVSATVQASADPALGAPPTVGSGGASQSMKTVGVLGGGQLGMMMAEAGATIDLALKVLEPTPSCPASSVAEQVLGSFTDPAAIREFAKSVDLLTVEIEHVDANALEEAAREAGIEVHPSPSVLRVIQDKWAQKEHFAAAGVPCAPAAAIASEADLARFGAAHGYPFMLKARRLAYDGRGNAVVSDPAGAAAALSALGGLGQGLYAEAWVPFRAELAVMVAQGRDGALRAFPVTQTLHRDSICVVTETPALIDPGLAREAERVALAAVASLPGAGVYGVEMFVVGDGDGEGGPAPGTAAPSGAAPASAAAARDRTPRLLLNEVAPRPHNSGHYTIEACATSQYLAHLQAVTGQRVGDTSLTAGAAIMVNVLGDGAGQAANAERIAALRTRAAAEPRCALHWYGKAEFKAKRKLGHFTIVADDRREARAALERVDPQAARELERAAPLAPATARGGTARAAPPPARVGILMGSDSDLPTMRAAAQVLADFGVGVEVEIVSAHRTPALMAEYAGGAAARGVQVIIAGAGGAAHLPGMLAAMTPLPVIGVPVVPAGARLDGVDALLSICQMPKGVPVATVAIGNAANAGLLAARILGVADPEIQARMVEYQRGMTDTVMAKREAMAAQGWDAYTPPS
ncbi:hypothetical protein ACKKBF_B13535 [Auxenochlorella protothecoides x Auxenochlorella symbiontica]